MRFVGSCLLATIGAMPATARAQDLATSIAVQITNSIINDRKRNLGLSGNFEEACLAGKPAHPKAVTRLKAASLKTISKYYTLTSKSDANAIGKVFATGYGDVLWQDASGTSSVWTLGERLDQPTPDLKEIAFVSGGDAVSARGVWQARWPNNPDKITHYGIGFRYETNALRIIDFVELTDGKEKRVPQPFCHYDISQKW